METREEFLEATRFPMGTYVTIKTWGKSGNLRDAVDAAFEEIERVDSITSVFSTRSAVYILNNGEMVTSHEIADLLETAQQVWVQSNGAFDPTIKPLIELWGFYDTDEQIIPADHAIEDALRFVNINNIEISDSTVKLAGITQGVDLGGIAKGYAVDRAVKELREQGLNQGLVDAGGDIYCFGYKQGGWKIGIRHPRGKESVELLGIITIDSGAVATSGDYENYFKVDGTRYHHLIDPKTGYPARNVMSATVIAPTAILADAWATALFIMGSKGINVLEEVDGVEGLVVTENGSWVTTQGFPPVDES